MPLAVDRLLRPALLVVALAAYLALVAWLCLKSALMLARDRSGGSLRAASLSMVVHMLLLSLLGLWSWNVGLLGSPTGTTLLAIEHPDEWPDPEVTPQVEVVNELTDVPDEAPLPGGGDDSAPEVQTFAQAELTVTSGQGIGRGDLEPNGLATFMARERQDGSENLDAEEAAKSPSKASFFGIAVPGQSFVFVVDISGSMQGVRWQRAKHELTQTLGSLHYEQEFSLIFFNHLAHPMTPGIMVPATSDNFVRTSHFVENTAPHGGTMPLEAMRMAFELAPDAIFFLTDGEFAGADKIVLMHRNHQKTIPVHTICLASPGAARAMAAVAFHTGGQYRFVQ